MQILFIVDVEDAQAAERLARQLEAAGVRVMAGPRIVPSPLATEGVLALSLPAPSPRYLSAAQGEAASTAAKEGGSWMSLPAR